jgi:GH25 family lysozyme M1 (1,4-beta-N-acetylmuramidase)
MPLYVVDAHCAYQSGLNVSSLKREGFSALIVKATEGSGSRYTAPARFNSWVDQARDAGLVPGAYHWLRGDVSARVQLDAFLTRIASVGGPAGMLIGLDVEDVYSPPSVAQACEWLAGFAGECPGHPVLFYSGAWWYGPHFGVARMASPVTRLWNSRYVSGTGYASTLYAGVPTSWWTAQYGGFDEVTLAQYTSRATCGGITGNVDVSAFRGTFTQLKALASAGSTQQGAGMGDPLTTDTPVPFRSDDVVHYASSATTITGALSSISYYGLMTRNLVNQVIAGQSDDATRDAGTAAAIEALTDALAAGQGGTGAPIDTAAIIERIDQRATESRALVESLQARLVDVHADLDAERATSGDLRAQLESLHTAIRAAGQALSQ